MEEQLQVTIGETDIFHVSQVTIEQVDGEMRVFLDENEFIPEKPTRLLVQSVFGIRTDIAGNFDQVTIYLMMERMLSNAAFLQVGGTSLRVADFPILLTPIS